MSSGGLECKHDVAPRWLLTMRGIVGPSIDIKDYCEQLPLQWQILFSKPLCGRTHASNAKPDRSNMVVAITWHLYSNKMWLGVHQRTDTTKICVKKRLDFVLKFVIYSKLTIEYKLKGGSCYVSKLRLLCYQGMLQTPLRLNMASPLTFANQPNFRIWE